MLIAHLPSGYLLGALSQKLAKSQSRAIMAAALFGSVAPDLDMLYFHLIDGRRTHHHDYFTHWPLFWVAVGLVLVAIALVARKVSPSTVVAFSAGTLLHMVMDSVAAPIHWLMPFNSMTVELVTIPARYSNWIWSFVLHWTFLLEIAICLSALGLFVWRQRLNGQFELEQVTKMD
jgi:inner membrane protein